MITPYDYGKLAHIKGLKRVPALDPDFMDNFIIGKQRNNIDYINEWLKGWDSFY